MRLFVDITSHGWGHLAQTAPIIEALRTRISDFQCVVRSALPRAIIEERLGPIFSFISSDSDFGLVMSGPFVVDRHASLVRYRTLHHRFDRKVDKLAEIIAKQRCHAVFSNVGYLALAAGKRAGLPTISCSSLNWADLFQFYCAGLDGAGAIQTEIDRCYREADLFLRLVPGMPMERFDTKPIVRAIARVGRKRRAELARALGISPEEPVILCAFGGMLPSTVPDFVRNPDGYKVVGPAAWRPFVNASADRLDMPYADVLASVDAVVTKPGYGIVAELGCLGTRSIMVSRGDWPEEKPLVEWLAERAAVFSPKDLYSLTSSIVHRFLISPRKYIHFDSQNGGERDVCSMIVSFLTSKYAYIT